MCVVSGEFSRVGALQPNENKRLRSVQDAGASAYTAHPPPTGSGPSLQSSRPATQPRSRWQWPPSLLKAQGFHPVSTFSSTCIAQAGADNNGLFNQHFQHFYVPWVWTLSMF
jgi:hypothetical protein